MSDTSASLLDRVRSNPHSEAWQRLVESYEPLVRGWLLKGLSPEVTS